MIYSVPSRIIQSERVGEMGTDDFNTIQNKYATTTFQNVGEVQPKSR